MRSLGLALLASAVATFVACASGHPTASEEASLVGGVAPGQDQLRSTLLLASGCTATKVGPRHILTAAHCVTTDHGALLRSGFAPGADVFVSNALEDPFAVPDGGPKPYRKGRVERTHVHPGWAADSRPEAVYAHPDVALLVLDQASASAMADIPEATVDVRPVNVGDPLVITGYGCEQGIGGPLGGKRVKIEHVRALGLESQRHPNNVLLVRDPELGSLARDVEKQYLFTPGLASTFPDAGAAGVADAGAAFPPLADGGRPNAASLCPGDSGGPVYRDVPGERLVVGVNAFYSFADARGISMTNWHTRLDGSSLHDVGSWLANIPGVRVAGTATDHFAGCLAGVPHPVCGAIARTYAEDFMPEHAGPPRESPRFVRRPDGAWAWSQRFASIRATVDPASGEVSTEAAFDPFCGLGNRCATSIGEADPRVLYTCTDGFRAEPTTCATTCLSEPAGGPTSDCAPAGWTDVCPAAGPKTFGLLFCGSSFGDPSPRAVYRCDGSRTFQMIDCRSCWTADHGNACDLCAKGGAWQPVDCLP